MRIIQVVQKPQLRGAEIFAAQLSTHLQQAGHEVILLTLFPGDASLPFTGCQVHFSRPLSRRLWDISGWLKLARLVKEFKPDIIQANAGDTLKFVVMSKKIFGWWAPIVFRNANKMSDFIDNKMKYMLNRYLLKSVAHVASVSDNCSVDIVNFFSLKSECVTTIEIGIDFRTIGAIPEDLIPIFSKGPVYLNVASLVPEKNHQGLLKIFASIRQSMPEAQLLIIGKGKLQEELIALRNKLGLDAHVHLLGYRHDILEIMSGSAAFLLPSLIEGLPAVILEAMWAKCPVVTYEVGGIGEVVKNNSTGFLVAKGDEVAFVNSVLKLNTEPNRSEIISGASRFVSDNFDNNIITGRFEELYRKYMIKHSHG